MRFTHSLCFLSVSPPPRKLAFGVPFFFKPFLLVWLFCCVRLTKKPNVALGAVWQTSFYGMLNFVTLRELSSLAAPSLPLLASPVASTNVETRLFCKESAFYALSLLFVGFSSSPKARFRGSSFLQALFACVAPPSKTGKKRPRKIKKIAVPQITPKNFNVKNPFSETKNRTA